MSASFVASTSGTSTTVTKPAGAQAADWLLVFVQDANVTQAITGFESDFDTVLSNNGSLHYLWRKLDGTEGASFTLSKSSTNMVWAALLYRGGGQPVAIGGASNGLSAGTTMSDEAIVPVDGTVVYAVGDLNTTTATSVSFNSVTGLTQRASAAASSFYAIAAADEHLSAGSDVTRGVTATTSGFLRAVHVLIPDSTSVHIPRIAAIASNASTSTAPWVAQPSGLTAGDLLVVCCQVVSSTITAVPAGFTSVDGIVATSGGTNPGSTWWGYKIAGSSEPASYVFTCGNQVWGTLALRITDVDQTTPVAVSGAGVTTSGTSTAMVSRTTGGSWAMALAILLAAQTNTGDAPLLSGTGPYIRASVRGGGQFPGWGSLTAAIGTVLAGAASLAPTVVFPANSSIAKNTILLNPASPVTVRPRPRIIERIALERASRW